MLHPARRATVARANEDSMPATTSLDPLFKPRSIAVIGASRRRDAIGGSILRNLLDLPFQGAVYPINPSATSIRRPRARSVNAIRSHLQVRRTTARSSF